MTTDKNNKKYTNSIKKFVVRRDGYRVSDAEYDTTEQASHEYNFWKRVIKNGKDPSSELVITEK
jgi:hypothetical protein